KRRARAASRDSSSSDSESESRAAAVSKRKRTRKESSAGDEEAAAGAGAASADGRDASGNLPASAYRLSKMTVDSLATRGVTHLFPIQAKTFDHILDGKDVIGRARTGMGKTLAFVLPIIERLRSMKISLVRGRKPKVIVMAPTRELAKQVADDFVSVAGEFTPLVVYGGTSLGPQQSALWRGIDILIGTPGRIQDLMQGGSLQLTDIQFVVRCPSTCLHARARAST
ncbi:DEAD/DEAH box helicase, partial [archaeon]